MSIINDRMEIAKNILIIMMFLLGLYCYSLGFISNGKEGTECFFASLHELLCNQFSVAEVVLRTKSNYSAPAEQTLIDEVKNWHAVVTGVGD